MASSPRPRVARSPRRAQLGPLLNTLIVAGGYLLSRVLGLGRDVIISSQFGTLPEYGVYRATFSILDLIYLVVAGGALGSAFIPVFADLLTQEREDDAWRLASAVLNIALVGLVLACVLIALLADPIVWLTIGRGFTPDERALAVLLLRLMLIQPVLLGLGGLAKATLESFDRFALPAIGSNLYNLGIIGGALLGPWLGIYGLVWGVIAGAALFLLVQLPGLRSIGARYISPASQPSHQDTKTPSKTLDLGALVPWWQATPGLGQVGRLLAPRLFGQAAWQINMIVIASFASLLGAAAIAANGYALTLMLLPHGLVALSLGTVLFPQLARLHAAGDHTSFRETALGSLRGVLFLALPAAAALALLAQPIVRVLFERGAFDTASAALTSQALVFYALGLPAFAAAEILVRTFYATQDTRTPVYVGIGAVLINIALGWSLLQARPTLGMLALAFSVANTIEALALLWLLRARLGGLGREFAGAVGRMLLAATLAGGTLAGVLRLSQPALPFLQPGDAYQWPGDFVPLALWLAAAGTLSLLVYGGAALLLRVPEMRQALARVGGLARRFRRRPE